MDKENPTNNKSNCQCDLCKRGRKYYEIIDTLPAEERQWMHEFYEYILCLENDNAVNELKLKKVVHTENHIHKKDIMNKSIKKAMLNGKTKFIKTMPKFSSRKNAYKKGWQDCYKYMTRESTEIPTQDTGTYIYPGGNPNNTLAPSQKD